MFLFVIIIYRKRMQRLNGLGSRFEIVVTAVQAPLIPIGVAWQHWAVAHSYICLVYIDLHHVR